MRLGPDLADAASVVRELNKGALVAASLDGDTVLARPTRQPTVAGIPAFYSGRPVFRGRVDQAGERAVLTGVVEESGLLVAFNVIGGLFITLGVLVGITLLVSGEVSGLAVILVALISGLALLAQTFLTLRLRKLDEDTIAQALARISDAPRGEP